MARILVVDDSELQALMQSAKLSEAGHDITTAFSGEEALNLARQSPQDIVVTDMYMPGLDGIGLCRALRAEPATKDLMIIVLTATSTDEIVIAARRARANYVVSKSDDGEGTLLLGYIAEAEERLRKRAV